jgi:hypothetical protein
MLRVGDTGQPVSPNIRPRVRARVTPVDLGRMFAAFRVWLPLMVAATVLAGATAS